MVGINVIITEESYTSKASFIDNDFLPVCKKGQKKQVIFSGKRIKRCSAAKGGFPHERLHQDSVVCIEVLIIGVKTADCNGAANIITKVSRKAVEAIRKSPLLKQTV